MVKTTRAQREALFRVFQRDFPGWLTPTSRSGIRSEPRIMKVPSLQWRRFRKRVTSYPDGSGCVMIQWRGMWLGIETDGYTHS